MRIIIIGTAFPYRGGLAAFNERLASQLQTEGHEVELQTFTLQYPGFLFPGKTQYTNGQAPSELRIERSINSCNPFNWFRVGRKISRKNPDLVIFAYWMSFMAPCFGTIALCLPKHTKRIGLIHNMIPHERNILDKLFPGYFIKAMDGFTALSESVLSDVKTLDKAGKTKNWAPHPIYDHYGEAVPKTAARKELGLDSEGKYVLFFGFIRDYKGLDLLLDAFGTPSLKESDINLIVAGEFYGDPEPYFDRIKRLGISSKVHLFNEYIPDNSVNKYFCACDIIAQPYKTATQSGVTQIAFHFGKPMLVTNVGGLGEIVRDSVMGYVVEPAATPIANAIRDFYCNNLEESFSSAVISEKAKYSWNRVSAAILSMVE